MWLLNYIQRSHYSDLGLFTQYYHRWLSLLLVRFFQKKSVWNQIQTEQSINPCAQVWIRKQKATFLVCLIKDVLHLLLIAYMLKVNCFNIWDIFECFTQNIFQKNTFCNTLFYLVQTNRDWELWSNWKVLTHCIY